MKIYDKGEISLLNAILFITTKRKILLFVKVGAVGLVIGLIIAFTTPEEYSTFTTTIPQVLGNQGSKLSPALGSLAGIAGISLDNSSEATQFPINLYPSIIGSKSFKEYLLAQKIFYEGDSLSFQHYLLEKQESSLLNKLLGLHWKVISLIKPNNEDLLSTANQKDSMIVLSKAKRKLYEQIDGRVYVSVDEESFVVTISVIMQDPGLSLDILKFTQHYIEDFVSGYALAKKRDNLIFLDKIISQTSKKLDSAQILLAKKIEQNQYNSSKQIEFDINAKRSYQSLLFSSLEEFRAEQNKTLIAIQKEIPVFKTLNPPFLPLEKTYPKRLLILVVSIFLFEVLTIAAVLSMKLYTDINNA